MGQFITGFTAGVWVREPMLNQGGKRGDLKVDNFLGGQTLVIDVTGTNNSLMSKDTLFATTKTKDARLQPGRYGQKAAQDKRAENESICKANGWRFQPFVLEALGGWDKSALLWAEQLMQAATDLGPTESGSMNPKGVKAMFIRKMASIHRKTLLWSVIEFSRKLSAESTAATEFSNDVVIPSWAEECNDVVQSLGAMRIL
jgi:hypothetical protein